MKRRDFFGSLAALAAMRLAKPEPEVTPPPEAPETVNTVGYHRIVGKWQNADLNGASVTITNNAQSPTWWTIDANTQGDWSHNL